MRIFIKSIALLLVIIMLVGATLISCKKKDPTPDNPLNESANSENSEDPSNEFVFISNKGDVLFDITYADNGATATVKEAIENFYTELKKLSGDVPMLTKSKIQNYNAEKFEILIGNTGYPESNEVLQTLDYGDWTIRFIGNKLVVAGFTEMSVITAIDEAIKLLQSNALEDKTISLALDTNIGGAGDDFIGALPRFDGAKFPNIVREGDDTYLFIFNDITLANYEEYLTTFEKEGFALYTTNKMGSNTFATYQSDEHLIHAAYYPNETAARITLEKKTALAGLEEDNKYTKNNDVVTSLALVGIGPAGQSGLSSIYQLADGSFLIIDGAFSDDAYTLYDYMISKAPNCEIVIAAWIITHGDGDHCQAFVEFAEEFSDVRIEKVIMNFPYIENGDTSVIDAARSIKNCDVVKVHTGQKFFIRNSVVEILYTMDNYLPDALTIFNDSSVVFTVDVEGERALYTGDAGEQTMKLILNNIFKDHPEYLESDILQLAHHGLRNGSGMSMDNTAAFYKIVRPEILLWPNSHQLYLEDKDPLYMISDFYWNKAACEAAREIYVAGNSGSITVLELPYTYYSAYMFDIEFPESRNLCADTPSSSYKLDFCGGAGASVADLQIDWSDGSN